MPRRRGHEDRFDGHRLDRRHGPRRRHDHLRGRGLQRGPGAEPGQQRGFFDQLPLGTQFQSSASADFDLAFDATSSQILGTTDQLQAGECGTAVITVSVADDAPCGTPFTNLAVAFSSTTIISDFPFDASNFVLDEDADPSNNEATVTTTVVCPEEDEDGKDDDGGGPSVGTGDTGLLDESSVAGWQLGLLSLLIVGSLSGAYVAARRVR